MKIKVFGALKDIVKDENISVEQATDLNDLREKLYQMFPGLYTKSFVVAVNKKIIHENILIQHNTEIALLPPFSGG